MNNIRMFSTDHSPLFSLSLVVYAGEVDACDPSVKGPERTYMEFKTVGAPFLNFEKKYVKINYLVLFLLSETTLFSTKLL